MINFFKKGYILGGVNLDSFKKRAYFRGVKQLLTYKFHDLGGVILTILVFRGG